VSKQEVQRIEIDRASGGILRWSRGGGDFVHAPAGTSALRLRDAVGQVDFIVQRVEAIPDAQGESRFVIGTLECSGLRLEGRLGAHPAIVEYRGGEAQEILAAVKIEKPASPETQAIRELTWEISPAFIGDTRIFFRTDHALEWDERTAYEFHTDKAGRFCVEPDVSIWRTFALDFKAADSFRLWKAESATTSPLTMHTGRLAAPSLQISDSRRALTMEIPRLRESAPMSLRADFTTATRLLFQIVSPAFPEDSQKSVLGVWHHIHLHAHDDLEQMRAERGRIAGRYPSTALPAAESVMGEPEWVRGAAKNQAFPSYVEGGWPFARGALRDVGEISVSVGGIEVPVQAKPLGFWPDGSMKWALLVFAMPEEARAAAASGPRITTRLGGIFPIVVGRSSAKVRPPKHHGIEVIENAGSVRVSTAGLHVAFSTGARWLTVNGVTNERLAYIDFQLEPDAAFPGDHRFPGGHLDAGELIIETIAVEESGPVRATVKLEGLTTNATPERIILRFQFFAGVPSMSITHTIVFRFENPQQTFLRAMGLAIPLPRGAGQTRSGTGWAGNDHCVGVIRNFRELQPKRITVENDRLLFELWPESAAPMDVRRYSEVLHRAQGEASESDDDLTSMRYDPEDLFVGVSRTHEMLVVFGDMPDPEFLSADFQSPPLLYGGWKTYEDAAVVLPAPSQNAWPHAWEAWTRFTNFFLWHREVHGWYGFWNFGDFRHYFRDGHGWVLPHGDASWLTAKALAGEIIPTIPMEDRQLDYAPANDWAYDNGRWGWSNTEGLPGLFLSHEYLRHGNRAVYFSAEAMARHARDVVTRHEGRWFGHGTRHGVQHWSDGNHEERQTTVTEYRLHYFLSGDARSRDVIEALYDGFYARTRVNIHASHSARLMGLLFHWELTGAESEAEQLKSYVRAFCSPDGIWVQPDVQFPGPFEVSPPQKLNDGSMFFHTFGAMHALIEYQALTADPVLAKSLLAMASKAESDPALLAAHVRGDDIHARIFWPALAFAARHGSDSDRFRKFLLETIRGEEWKRLFQPVTANPAHWSGHTAGVAGHGQVPVSFFWQNWAAYLGWALGGKEPWSEEIARACEALEMTGYPIENTRTI